MPYSAKTLLARKGRDGDTLLGHLTPGDVVISRERQERDPAFKAKLREIMGNDLDRFTAGSAWNSKNPHTGLAEFAEGGSGGGSGGSDGGGSNGSDAGGGSAGGDTSAAGAAAGGASAADPSAGVDANAAAASSDAASLGAGPQAAGLGLTGKDIFGNDINARTSGSLSDESGAAGVVGALGRSIGFNATPQGDITANSNLVGNAANLGIGAIGGPIAGEVAGALAGRAAQGLGVAAPAGQSLGDKLGDALGFGGINTGGGAGPGGTGGAGTADAAGGSDPWGPIFADITRSIQPATLPTTPAAAPATNAAPTAAAALNPSQIQNATGLSPETIALLSDQQRQALGL